MHLLIPAALAAVLGVAWWLITGSRHLPWPAVVGLALAAGAIAHLVEGAVHRLRVRRARPQRRTHARPHPTRKAAP
ncbi:hypothetical protein [Streptomyces africanus]|uniref:hypothetical protein n=1 Tax=Streptomyces africanus TaxID=231024 RepID=UPI000A3CB392|nr:hypothetical protein [Streptomyces africanus]